MLKGPGRKLLPSNIPNTAMHVLGLMRGMGGRKWLRPCGPFPNSVFYCCGQKNTRRDGWTVGPHGMLL